ncbi:malonyl-ACP O-methyltransferase BioC [Vibrio algarum]|uniref:Malonyl-[acyl-carrier protein] O-methyltransferase n=1 Tax=Vibrio algarum TaxID=3020714 RepID=A0ABT4YS50_9VIBR|nr:malonyl-ACP O-methyltransferase BioC [Vibrio sp. KJ40-1]MDB1124369.1 malonyl-ACP O-methyltransferase BioC [Vibrio sp. KJ40-1]
MDCIVSRNSTRKLAIAEAFSKAARVYDQHAQFQRDVGLELIGQLPSDLSGMKVLDIGCGTGFCSELLAQKGAEIVAADLSSQMLQQAEKRCKEKVSLYCQADAEALPFERGEFDIVFSSLALQWCDDLADPLRELQRVTKKGGLIKFSTLMSGSLIELKRSWAEIDSHQHVNNFLSDKQIKIALAQAGSQNHHLELLKVQLWYTSAFELMRDLKGIGATHVGERSPGLTKKSTLTRVETEYQRFKNDNDLLPATYQVCLGTIFL